MADNEERIEWSIKINLDDTQLREAQKQIGQAGEKAGEALGAGIKKGVQTATGALDQLKQKQEETFSSLEQAARTSSGIFDTIAEGATSLSREMGSLSSAAENLASSVESGATSTDALSSQLGSLAGGGTSAAQGLNSAAGAMDALGGASGETARNLSSFVPAAENVARATETVIEKENDLIRVIQAEALEREITSRATQKALDEETRAHIAAAERQIQTNNRLTGSTKQMSDAEKASISSRVAMSKEAVAADKALQSLQQRMMDMTKAGMTSGDIIRMYADKLGLVINAARKANVPLTEFMKDAERTANQLRKTKDEINQATDAMGGEGAGGGGGGGTKKGFAGAVDAATKEINYFLVGVANLGANLATDAIRWFANEIKNMVGEAMQFEALWRRVKNTMDGTPEQFEELSAAVRELSLELPASALQLASLAGISAQLQIPQEHLIDFMRTVEKFATVIGTSAEGSARSLVYLNQALGRPREQVDDLTNMLYTLEKQSTATAEGIMEVAIRLAQGAKVYGMSDAAILSLSASLARTGSNAGALSMAFTTAFQAIDEGVRFGGRKIIEFARTAQMAQKDFEKLWKVDAAEAFMRFLEGLGKAGNDTYRILDRLGLGSNRIARAFQLVAANMDEVRQLMVSGTEAQKNTNLLDEKFAETMTDVNKQLELMGNQLHYVFLEVGVKVTGVLVNLLRPLNEAMVLMSKGEVINGLSGAIMGLGVALVFLNRQAVLAVLSNIILAGSFKALAAGIYATWLALGPYVAVLAAMYIGYKTFTDQSERIREGLETISKAWKNVADSINSAWQKLKDWLGLQEKAIPLQPLSAHGGQAPAPGLLPTHAPSNLEAAVKEFEKTYKPESGFGIWPEEMTRWEKGMDSVTRFVANSWKGITAIAALGLDETVRVMSPTAEHARKVNEDWDKYFDSITDFWLHKSLTVSEKGMLPLKNALSSLAGAKMSPEVGKILDAISKLNELGIKIPKEQLEFLNKFIAEFGMTGKIQGPGAGAKFDQLQKQLEIMDKMAQRGLELAAIKEKGALEPAQEATLGIVNAAAALDSWNKAYKDLLEGGVADKYVHGVAIALQTGMKLRLEVNKTLPEDFQKALDKMLNSEHQWIVQGAIPIYRDMILKMKGENGQMSAGFEETLMQNLHSTKRYVVDSLLPIWKEYVIGTVNALGEVPERSREMVMQMVLDNRAILRKEGVATLKDIIAKTADTTGAVDKWIMDFIGKLATSADVAERTMGVELITAVTSGLKAAGKEVPTWMLDFVDKLRASLSKSVSGLGANLSQAWAEGMATAAGDKPVEVMTRALKDMSSELEQVRRDGINTWNSYLSGMEKTKKDMLVLMPEIIKLMQSPYKDIREVGVKSFDTMIENAKTAFGRIPDEALPAIQQLIKMTDSEFRQKGVKAFDDYVTAAIETTGIIPEAALETITLMLNNTDGLLREKGLAYWDQYHDLILRKTREVTPEYIASIERWIFGSVAILRDKGLAEFEDYVNKTRDIHGQIPEWALADIEKMIWSQNAVLQTRGIAMWADHVKSVTDYLGRIPEYYIQQTINMMMSGNRMMQEAAAPAWEWITKVSRDQYGRLRTDLYKINQDIERNVEITTGKMAQDWQNSISQTFDRLVDSAATSMIECENLLKSFRDILKGFAKMIMEMFFTELFRPFKKAFEGLFSGQGFNLNLGSWFTGFMPGSSGAGGAALVPIYATTGAVVGYAQTPVGGASTSQIATATATPGGSTTLYGNQFSIGKTFAGTDYAAIPSSVYGQSQYIPDPGEGYGILVDLPEKIGDSVQKSIQKVDWTAVGRGMATGLGLALYMDAARRGGTAGVAEGGLSGFMMGWGKTGTLGGGLAGAGLGAGSLLLLEGFRNRGAKGIGLAAGGGALTAGGLLAAGLPSLSLAGGAGAGAGAWMMVDAWRRGGTWGGVGESAAGGALAGTMFLPGIGTAIGAAVGAIVGLIRKAFKSAYLSGSMEVMRDLNVQVGMQTVEEFTKSVGLTKKQFEGIRKDVSVSPKFLIEVAGPAAKAAGTYQQFLKSLENVTTAWGTFNFRKAYEIGDATGDWSMLNYQFKEAFKNSTALKENMPDWETLLMGTVDVAKGFKYYTDQLRETGKVSDEFKVFCYENADALEELAKSSYSAAKTLALVSFETLYDQMVDIKEISPTFVQFVTDNIDVLKRWGSAFPEVQSGIKIAQFETFFQAMQQGAEVSEEFSTWLKINREDILALADTFPELKAQMDYVDLMSLFTDFMAFGVMTDELKNKILSFGYSLDAFTELSRITEIRRDFQDLVAVFNETGEILPELRQMFTDWGGDLAVLDEAAQLPQLKATLSGLDDFVSGLDAILPITTGLQDVLNGEWDENTFGKLLAEGLDPMKFVNITDLIKIIKGWDEATQEYLDAVENAAKVGDTALPKLDRGGIVAQALYKYGGTEGANALKLYFDQGINTITPDLLKKTKLAVDTAFETEREQVKAYIRDVAEPLLEKVNDITTRINEQFSLVGSNIEAAFEKAKYKVLGILDDIYNKMIAVTSTPIEVTVRTNVTPGGAGDEETDNVATGKDRYYDRGPGNPRYAAIAQLGGFITRGGLAILHDNEYVAPADISRDLAPFRPYKPDDKDGGSSRPTVTVKEENHFHFEGATINGMPNFEKEVAKAWTAVRKRGGFSYIPDRS